MEKLLNNFKIAFTKGDTYALAVKLKNITEDLGSAYFTVKENPEDEPLIQKSLNSGISKTDDRAYKKEKTYKIQLQSEDTANLEPLVQYLYDFRVAIGNVVKTVLSGVFVVNHNISEVSTTITSTLEVAVDDTVEGEASTTPATNGIEYEQDPVACAKIGDMAGLNTTAKQTLVQAINEVNTGRTTDRNDLDKILNGTTAVPKATNANSAKSAESATKAEKTDFTNSEWTTVAEPTDATAINLNSGTYEFLVYGNDMLYQFQGGISKVVTVSGAFVDDNGVGSIRLGSYAENTGDVFKSVHVDLILSESETGGYSAKVKMTKKASDTATYYPPFKYRKIR